MNTAFSALALAALGNEAGGKTLVPGAGRQYHKAMQEAKVAFKDPTTATLDSTLATLVLFAYFEVCLYLLLFLRKCLLTGDFRGLLRGNSRL